MNLDPKIVLTRLVVTVALCVAAFATYNAKAALLVLLVLIPLNALATMAGCIPVAGPFIYWAASKSLVFGWFFSTFPDVNPTWLTSLVFWVGLIQTILMTLVGLLRVAGPRPASP